MARKKKPDKPPNHERWLVSYADFITLMFAFFVVMFSTASEQDPGKQKAVEQAFRKATGLMSMFSAGTASGERTILTPSAPGGADITISVQPSDQGLAPVLAPGNVQTESPDDFEARSPDESDEPFPGQTEGGDSEGSWPTPPPTPVETPPPPETQAPTETPGSGPGPGGSESMASIYDNLRTALTEELAQNLIEIKQERRGIVISLSEAGFFDSGSAVLKPRSLQTVDRIARKLASFRRQVMVRVEGHTDNVPIGRHSQFLDNRDLSSARANTVIRHLENLHFPEPNLIAAGCGEWRPVASNDTEEGRARNRRVDIVILNEEYAALEASSRRQN
ncbi:OmpA family protein [Candidatus Sumerlaeota bacterium]|nr:OmpA family protein [Candidatus Sumerlaeota bacterium]